MLKFFSVHKKKMSVLTLLIILTALIVLNLFGFKDFLCKKYSNVSVLKEFKDNKFLSEHIVNDYNTFFELKLLLIIIGSILFGFNLSKSF